MKQSKNLGARGVCPSGGAVVPRQQKSRSKNSTEVEREWEKKGDEGRNEVIQLQLICIKYRTMLALFDALLLP